MVRNLGPACCRQGLGQACRLEICGFVVCFTQNIDLSGALWVSDAYEVAVVNMEHDLTASVWIQGNLGPLPRSEKECVLLYKLRIVRNGSNERPLWSKIR